ncbi:MAG: flagellum-specific synthase, partial [Microbacteriaceae bacterium]|nr:flagellum-specific synthase [Microbacteriaceae bacterium]
PAVDPLASISRVASRVNSRENTQAATVLRRALAARKSAQDLLDVGAYSPGSNPLVDAAVQNEDAIADFLQQSMDERMSATEAWQRLGHLTGLLGAA